MATKMQIVKTLFLTILIIMVTGAGESIAQHEITGSVTDVHGNPVAGAAVAVAGTTTGVVTATDGSFRLELPAGRHNVMVRHVGYRIEYREITMPDMAGIFIEFTLAGDVVQSEEILITASLLQRITRYQPVRSYHTAEVQQRNTTSIGTLLDGEPGVAMRSMGPAPARPVVRGMDGERIQVLQNGMKMGDISSTAHDHAVVLDPMTADRVDIVRGPASLLYGSSALGGLVNVHTDDIVQNWSSGVGGYTSLEAQSATRGIAGASRWNYGTDAMNLTVRGSVRQTGDMRTPIGAIPDTDLSSVHLGSGLSWKRSGGFTGASVSWADQHYGIPEDPDDPQEEIRLYMQRLAVQGLSNHSLDHSFWQKAEFRVTYNYYHHEEWEREYLLDGTLDDEDLELKVTQNHIQGDLLLQHGHGTILRDGTAGVTLEYRDSRVGGDEALTPDARALTLAGFLLEEFELAPGMMLQAGLRTEWNWVSARANEGFPDGGEHRSRGVWAAALGLNRSLGQSVQLGIQVARSHRIPSIEELFADAAHIAASRYEIGNPSLGNEIGYGLDLFADYTGSGSRVHLALFANRISNYIRLQPLGMTDPVRGLPVLEYTGSDALLAGGEFQLLQQVSRNLQWHVNADYTYGSELSVGEKQPLPFMPPLRLAVGIEYDTGRWWSRARVRHALSQERTAPDEAATDAYTLTHLATGLKLGSSHVHTMTLSVDNLFNVTWRDHLSRIEQRDIPMMGRNIRLSYRITF
jgi:iron complex outermembrane recepter protein